MGDQTRSPNWHGVFPYLVTPSDADATLREADLKHLIDFVIDAGVHGITPLGSTGEMPFFTEETRDQVIAVAVEHAAGRVPVVGGVGGFSTAATVRQATRAKQRGVDGLLVTLQAYTPLHDAQIVQFYTDVANATDLPIVIYHHHKLCHVELSVPVAHELATLPNVYYVKESSGNLTFFNNAPALAHAGLHLFGATAISPVVSMLLGGIGWMSGPACVFPRESVVMYDLCHQGRYADAIALERAIEPALQAFRKYGPAPATKALLRARGLDMGDTVAPVLATIADADVIITNALAAADTVMQSL